jgi:hypothetical protein
LDKNFNKYTLDIFKSMFALNQFLNKAVE